MIANITFMFENVIINTKRKFSEIIFKDYMQNIPNNYYSSISFGTIPFGPFILLVAFFKSKRLNSVVNYFLYYINFFVFFIGIYYFINLLLLPLVYIKILYCIIRGNY